MSSIAITLHVLAAIIWVGGMFFAHMALRPAIGQLEPHDRLALMARSLGLFFNWVWLAIVVLYISGSYLIVGMGGFGVMPVYVLTMAGISTIMSILFAYIYLFPYRTLFSAVARAEFALAAQSLRRIRLLVTVNLCLGLITVVIAQGLKGLGH